MATFTQDLVFFSQKYFGTGTKCIVAAFNLSLDTCKYPAEVSWEIDQENEKDYLKLANDINTDENISGVILQHEYGIFGGRLGEKILSFMRVCTKPILVTLHTVLPHPTPKMKEVTREVIKLARTVVVLTQSSKDIVETIYPDSIGKVFVIPHGIPSVAFSDPEEYKAKLELKNHIVLSTFGLLSRGKGIEYAINALSGVIKKYPSLIYLILGETHPIIRRKEGEKYRLELAHLVRKLGLEKHVKFYDQYLNLTDLIEFLKATDIYIATSINPNQSVSGTFSYAMGAGRAVISTEFAQAIEMVTSETGRLVPIKNSPSLSQALLDLLSDKKRLKQMHQTAYAITRPMLWSNVAKQYIRLLKQTMIPPLNLHHLQRMTDDFGLFQFAARTAPDKDFGYTLDDNARALIVCSFLIKQQNTKELEDLMTIYLSFIKTCQQPDGSFINYISHAKSPSPQNNLENLEDAQSRSLWALSEVMTNKCLSSKLRDQAKKIFLLTFQSGPKPTFLRSCAFTIKSFAKASEILPKQKVRLLENIIEYADSLMDALKEHSYESWHWFENHLSYSNGLLPESLLIAGSVTNNVAYRKKGISSLQFLIDKTFTSKYYLPIGQSHWYKNKQKRSQYDQQPEDPAAMILALVSAYRTTHNEIYKTLARQCFSWYLGNNSLNIPLYDEKTGGSYDGLQPEGVNLNQGAESLVSYLMSRLTIEEIL